jgi:patatin-like phospholipase/acyl hydrolase
MYRILVLNGGGIKCYLTLEVLKYIEKTSGKTLYDMFDLVVGTSAGAFIGTLLDTLPAWYISNLIKNIYRKPLFTPNSYSVNGLLKTKYNTKIKEACIHELLKNKTSFKNLDFAAVSYDIRNQTPVIFNTLETEINEQYLLTKHFNISDAIIASSAAPIFWDPYLYKDMILIDGGIYCNNPTNIALKLALNKNIKLEDLAIVNIGTGILTRKYNFLEGHSMFKWLLPLLNISMGAQSTLNNMIYSNEELKYYNLDIALKNASDDIDDISNKNLANLALDAELLIEKHRDILNTILITF